MSHPKLFIPFIALCALLAASGLAAAEPPAPETSNEIQPTDLHSGSRSTANPAVSGSVIAWDAELRVFQAPAKDQMSRLAEDLKAALLQMPIAAAKAEKVHVRDGIYRMGLGAESMSLSMHRVDADGNPIAACVQVGSLTHQVHTTVETPASATAHAADPERPRSLPATEGWVEQ